MIKFTIGYFNFLCLFEVVLSNFIPKCMFLLVATHPWDPPCMVGLVIFFHQDTLFALFLHHK